MKEHHEPINPPEERWYLCSVYTQSTGVLRWKGRDRKTVVDRIFAAFERGGGGTRSSFANRATLVSGNKPSIDAAFRFLS